VKDITLPKIFEPFHCSNIVRLGKDYDGGYLVNYEDVLKSTRLISFGIGNDVSFEEDFVKINDCRVDAYDGTIDHCAEFFSSPNKNLYIANIGHSSGNKRLSEILTEEDRNVFLKCDIDGAEYEILDELIEHSHKFSGIAIEFHQVYEYTLFNLLSNFIAKTNLKLIHTHLNNNSYIEIPNGYIPDCVELSFTSSNNISLSSISLPHKLDMPNMSSRDDFRILF
jgi:hypothetical protein